MATDQKRVELRFVREFDEEEFATVMYVVPDTRDIHQLRYLVRAEVERIALALDTVFKETTFMIGRTLDFRGTKIHVIVER